MPHCMYYWDYSNGSVMGLFALHNGVCLHPMYLDRSQRTLTDTTDPRQSIPRKAQIEIEPGGGGGGSICLSGNGILNLQYFVKICWAHLSHWDWFTISFFLHCLILIKFGAWKNQYIDTFNNKYLVRQILRIFVSTLHDIVMSRVIDKSYVIKFGETQTMILF